MKHLATGSTIHKGVQKPLEVQLRQEVLAVTDKVVRVKETSSVGGKEYTSFREYSRDKPKQSEPSNKYSITPDDGKGLRTVGEKIIRQENTIKEVKLVYELVEFGNTKEQKKKK